MVNGDCKSMKDSSVIVDGSKLFFLALTSVNNENQDISSHIGFTLRINRFRNLYRVSS